MTSLQNKIESHSYHEPNSGCILWTGPWFRSGYGQIKINSKNCRAHRIAWTVANGPIPHGAHVLHKCDTPACVNPDHLFIGNAFLNMQDCIAKGRRRVAAGDAHGSRTKPERRPRGTQHFAAALTEDGVRLARTLYAAGDTITVLAERFGVRHSTMWAVLRGKTWKHVR